ncbi:NadS family protein [Litoribrevibacter euphylliae]|uniref:NadS family protein n=1 Tax=Litoribrevibacter euphylliae TaxID=1834034 RepID=A0ABV7HKS7_9GAMM
MEQDMFDELMASIQQMDDIVQGKDKASRAFDFPDPEVKAIREKLGVPQEKFALLLGVSKRTVENWEQGRRHPTGAARSLLRLVEADPQYALKVLHG